MKPKNKLLCFIVPYFGILPKEIDVFLLTVRDNPEYNWLLYIDDKSFHQYPDNIKVVYCSFDDFKERVQSKFSFEIALDYPKKLCDFKPAYGYVLQEDIREYDFWGYCDLDQYFGHLGNWLTEEYLEQYDRCFSLGHLTIYRNTSEINRLFMNDDNRDNVTNNYIDVFQSPSIHCFDEIPRHSVSINQLAIQSGIRQSYDWFFADIGPYRSVFIESFCDVKHEMWSASPKGTSFLILWQKGHIFLLEFIDEIIYKKEVMYVHIQKRDLDISEFYDDMDSFIIYPNRVISSSVGFSDKLLADCFRNIKKRHILRIDENKKKANDIKKIVIHWIKKIF